MQDNPADFDNDCIEHCSDCDSDQMGTERYANDASGMATPVLWLCHRCENPPILVGLWRKIKIRTALHYGRARYYLTSTKEERATRKAHMARMRAKIDARRKANGLPLLGARIR